MFTPEINFLKERPNDQGTAGFAPLEDTRVSSGIMGGVNAIIIGTAVAIVAAGAAVAYGQLQAGRLRELEAQQATVTQDLNTAQSELTRLQGIRRELDAIEAQTEAFKSFFRQVQPWSAILQDLRNRIPADVWITSMESSLPIAPPTVAATPVAADPAAADAAVPVVQQGPAAILTVEGESLSFEQINDFVLTLLQSPFVSGVQIVRGEKIEPLDETFIPSVAYTLEVELRELDLASAEYQETLSERGAAGLVEKIDILRDLEVN